jgi:hypothetical protein
MLKGYITGWKERETPEERHIVDVGFDHNPEKAACWKTRQEAANDCVIFDHWRVVIPSAEGGTHVCRDFRVEERAPAEFVVFCEGPFILRNRSESMTGGQSTPNPSQLAPKTLKGGSLAGQTGKVQRGVIAHCGDVVLTGDTLVVEDFRRPALNIDAFICQGEVYDVSQIIEASESGQSVGTRSGFSIEKSSDAEHVKEVLSYYEQCLEPEEPVERRPIKKFTVRAHRLDGEGHRDWDVECRDGGNAVSMARERADSEGIAAEYNWETADVVK